MIRPTPAERSPGCFLELLLLNSHVYMEFHAMRRCNRYSCVGEADQFCLKVSRGERYQWIWRQLGRLAG